MSSSFSSSSSLALISLVALWPAACYLAVCFMYLTKEHYVTAAFLFGKPSMYGRLHHRFASLCMLPVLLPMYAYDYAQNSSCCFEISKGLYIGDSLLLLPAETTTLVDVCAEYANNNNNNGGLRHIALPSARWLAAQPEDLREVAGSLVDQMSINNMNLSRRNSSSDPEGLGIRGRGTVYCIDHGEGLGRAVAFAVVLLVMRGESEDVAGALERVRRAPGCSYSYSPTRAQLANAQRAIDLWRLESSKPPQNTITLV